MGIGSIIAAIVVGLIIGALGRLFAPGKQNISILVTIIVGILAALLGTWLAGVIGVEDTGGIDWIELAIQIGLAVVGVTIAANLLGSRRRV
ncbi:GlsB/YeaQ/YmgE family stress response membrane protein [Cellulomonas sp. APG4]|uniref:GlsB/YeaQ/YmgE family stress response membrane protein n=1 Tax=Cellulomonas sp. APG4 TaxID=1538656 RepID=UPI00137B1E81|nr:GlsB/YeaQ/YmgE family stress response membrane protein [Cellulomonas sp. APG4]NCT90283.1 GlsB/YeaQ/YmgE family stress response membrane protein [Cellulomonas sp. APG4]